MRTLLTILCISTIAVVISEGTVIQERVPCFGIILSGDILLLVVLLLWKCAVSVLETTAVYNPDKVLQRSRPFYARRGRWNHIRKKAFLHKLGHAGFSSFIHFIRPYYFTDKKADYV